MFRFVFLTIFLVLFNIIKCQINFPGSGTGSTVTSAPTPYIQTNICQCVNSGKCSIAGGSSNTFDVRIVNGGSGSSSSGSTVSTSIASSGITPIIASQSSCSSGLDLCCPSNGYSCGIQYSPYTSAPSASGTQGDGRIRRRGKIQTEIISNLIFFYLAPYGSYPWQAVILV